MEWLKEQGKPFADAHWAQKEETKRFDTQGSNKNMCQTWKLSLSEP